MAVIRRLDKVKTFAAVVGGGAAVALGIVGAVAGGSVPAAPAVVSVGEMTLGNTATVGYSATEETSVAVPAAKATPPCGFKSGC